MIWQDAVFLCGSVFSLVVLVPTLRDSMANVPLGTALPSATIGFVYGTAFFTLGMTMSAVGSVLTGVMWSLIAALRSPHPYNSSSDSEVSRSTDSTTNGAPHAD
ncbi:hypothetical protein [Halorussus sp. MSC15.2]|uniref:hypothetical protein n=1 Tax=Halorussus sp. MSC15.2 TaxID=2283638 RepID=UPI00196756EC|nr:hypothetical protein [Halorussus sp. MSC15.2]